VFRQVAQSEPRFSGYGPHVTGATCTTPSAQVSTACFASTTATFAVETAELPTSARVAKPLDTSSGAQPKFMAVPAAYVTMKPPPIPLRRVSELPVGLAMVVTPPFAPVM